MIRVDSSTRRTIWVLIGLIIGAGWVAYGILGDGSNLFLTIMFIVSMLLAGGAGILLRGE